MMIPKRQKLESIIADNDYLLDIEVITIFEKTNHANYLKLSIISDHAQIDGNNDNGFKTMSLKNANLELGIPSNSKNFRDDIVYLKLAGFSNNNDIIELKIEIDSNSRDVRIGKPTLTRGNLLFFEETVDPFTGDPRDADPNHRHVIRLSDVFFKTDPLNGIQYFEIFFENDPLTFPLCIWEIDGSDKQLSKAIGNILLADHGYTLDTPEPLELVFNGRRKNSGLFYATIYCWKKGLHLVFLMILMIIIILMFLSVIIVLKISIIILISIQVIQIILHIIIILLNFKILQFHYCIPTQKKQCLIFSWQRSRIKIF